MTVCGTFMLRITCGENRHTEKNHGDQYNNLFHFRYIFFKRAKINKIPRGMRFLNLIL